ncbi:MAG: hypothetical protein ABIR59_09275 [Gemmatimonadales bacterium]
MTLSYWLRIVLGALAIFAVGMLIRTGIRRGHDQVEYVMDGNGPISLPLLGLAFRLEGESIGGIERLRLLRSSPRHIDSVVVVVKLAEGSSLDWVDGCRLTVEDAEHLSDETSFSCADSASAVALNLIPFGHVEFKPSGKVLAVWLPESVAADLRTTRVGDGAAQDTGDVDIRRADAGVSVLVNGHEVHTGVGTPAGGGVVVTNSQGRTVVRVGGGPGHPAPPIVPVVRP